MSLLGTYLERFSAPLLDIVGPFNAREGRFSEPCVFVDGGCRYRHDHEGISVGDGDSFPGALDIRLNPDKDLSDLAFVLNAIPKTYQTLKLHGFLGGRRDHELINFGEVICLLQRLPHLIAWFDESVAIFGCGRHTFHRHGVFSLFCFENVTLHLTGACTYPLPPASLLPAHSSLGLSNVGSGEITLQTSGPILLMFVA